MNQQMRESASMETGHDPVAGPELTVASTEAMVPSSASPRRWGQQTRRPALPAAVWLVVGIAAIAFTVARRQNVFKDLLYSYAWKHWVSGEVDAHVEAEVGFLPGPILAFVKKKAQAWARDKGAGKVNEKIAATIQAQVPGPIRWLLKLD